MSQVVTSRNSSLLVQCDRFCSQPAISFRFNGPTFTLIGHNDYSNMSYRKFFKCQIHKFET